MRGGEQNDEHLHRAPNEREQLVALGQGPEDAVRVDDPTPQELWARDAGGSVIER